MLPVDQADFLEITIDKNTTKSAIIVYQIEILTKASSSSLSFPDRTATVSNFEIWMPNLTTAANSAQKIDPYGLYRMVNIFKGDNR